MLPRQTTRPRSAIAAVPLGPANGNVDFFAHSACAQPGVDPSIFTSEEDDQQAVAAARAVCSSCPVRLPCRRYAYDANPYGVYAGETQTERVANRKLRGLAAGEHYQHREGGGVTAFAACLLCCGPVGPDQPRCPAFALAGVVVHVGCCSGCRTPGHGTAGAAANQPRAAP